MISTMEEIKKDSIVSFVMALLMILLGFINSRLFIIFYLPILFLLKRMAKRKAIDYSLNVVDFGIIIIAVYEFISLFLPGHLGISNQIVSAQTILCVSVLWFFLRLFVLQEKQIKIIYLLISVVAGILSILTIIFFIKHKQFVNQMGSDDMISFRAFYHPLGCISNDWCAILICLLPMPVVGIINSVTFLSTLHIAKPVISLSVYKYFKS